MSTKVGNFYDLIKPHFSEGDSILTAVKEFGTYYTPHEIIGNLISINCISPNSINLTLMTFWDILEKLENGNFPMMKISLKDLLWEENGIGHYNNLDFALSRWSSELEIPNDRINFIIRFKRMVLRYFFIENGLFRDNEKWIWYFKPLEQINPSKAA